MTPPSRRCTPPYATPLCAYDISPHDIAAAFAADTPRRRERCRDFLAEAMPPLSRDAPAAAPTSRLMRAAAPIRRTSAEAAAADKMLSPAAMPMTSAASRHAEAAADAAMPPSCRAPPMPAAERQLSADICDADAERAPAASAAASRDEMSARRRAMTMMPRRRHLSSPPPPPSAMMPLSCRDDASRALTRQLRCRGHADDAPRDAE